MHWFKERLHLNFFPVKDTFVNAEPQPGACTGAQLGSMPTGRSMACQGVLMADLIRPLAFFLETPVLDLTDMPGRYDLQLHWDADTKLDTPQALMGAVSKLGMKLKRRRQPMPVIVIDSLDRTQTGN